MEGPHFPPTGIEHMLLSESYNFIPSNDVDLYIAASSFLSNLKDLKAESQGNVTLYP